MGVGFAAAAARAAQEAAAPARSPSSRRLQPFVDRHTLAGAVTLVADKDKVLSLEAVGYADIAARKPMRTDAAVLDRLAVQADHRHRADDAGGRGQGEAGRPGGEVPAGVQGPVAGRRAGQGRTCCSRSRSTRSPSATSSATPAACRSSRRWSSRRSTCCRCAWRVGSYAMTPLQFEPGTQVPVFQRRHQHGGPDHRGRQRHALRGVPATSGCSSRWA